MQLLMLFPGTGAQVCSCRGMRIGWAVKLMRSPPVQALKANPECAPRELKVNANYIGRFGQVALTEALDMVYDLAQGREITITY